MAVELSSTSVTEGTAITVTMSFSNLESDDDRATTDYLFRADVVDADGCEDQAGGYGLGVDRKINLVDEEPETRRGTISAGCPAGDYTVRATVSSPQNVELAAATADFSVAAPEPPASSDAALSGLTLSGVTLAFDSDTTSYTAEVGNDVAETTVSPTLNDDGATYAVRLDGAADDDGIIPLAVGGNVISVLVTAEDGETTRTYTVTVTRAEAPPEPSSDAALSGLALSGVTLEFDPATTTYTAEVSNDLAETTVTPTLNDAGATYAVRLDGAADDDGIVPLSVGENAISVVVTAEDGETTRTYTVTVTRAEAPPELSSDATLSNLALSGITLEFDSDTTTYTAEVGNDVAETTVTPTLNDDGATYAVRLDGAADEDGVIPLAVGENAISVLVTAEDGETTRTYTVTVTRAEPQASDPTVAIALAPSDTVIEGEGTEIAVTMTFGNLEEDSDRATTDYVFRADVKDSEDGDADECEDQAGGYGLGVDRKINQVDEDPEVRRGAISADCPAGVYTLRVSISADSVEVASATAEFYVLPPPDVYEAEVVEQPEEEEPVSSEQNAASVRAVVTDAGAGMKRIVVSWNDPMPCGAHVGYRYVVRLSSTNSEETDSIGSASRTATQREKTYADTEYHTSLDTLKVVCTEGVFNPTDLHTVGTITVDLRTAGAYPPSNDATLSALTVSPTDIIGFASDTTDYHVGVANSVTHVTITATANDANATISIGGTDVTSGTGHQVTLSEGLNTVTITVTAEDTNTEEVYTIHIGRGVTAAFGWKATDDFNSLGFTGHGFFVFPLGLWSNGKTLWVVELGTRAYAYNLDTKARDVSEDFVHDLGVLPYLAEDIWSDGTTMWVVSADDKIFAYNMQTSTPNPGQDFNTLAAAGNRDAVGIWSDGETMWVSDNVDKRLYAYDFATKLRNSEKDIPVAEVAYPSDIWSDGATMWVVDAGNGTDTIYAYDLATGARLTDQDFDTLRAGGQVSPQGIWSDGATMWVTEGYDDEGKIYSYNMPPSRNTFLESISVNGLPVPGVNRADTEYTHTVAVTETTVTVAAQPAHPGASVTSITPADSDTNTAGHQVALNPDGETPTEVTITVTAEDGTTREYSLSVGFRPKDAPPALQTLKLVYRPALERILIGRCSGAPGITCAVGEPGATVFDVDTGTVDAVTVAANPTSPHATVSIDHPDFDRDAGGHQVKLAGLGTSGITIKVTVANRDDARATYRINVTRQLSGDTRLGALSVTETGAGIGSFVMYESLYTDPDSGQRLVGNLEPEFITEWDEAAGRPRRSRYRATLLIDSGATLLREDTVTVTAKELHAGATVHISATDVDGISSLFDADRNTEGFQISLLGSAAQQMLPVVINVRAENGAFHDYDLVFVKRDSVGSPPPVLAEVFKGSNHHTYRPSMFVDWVDWQYPILSIQGLPRPRDCDKAYNVATEYISDTRQGWFSHPVTNHDQDGDPVLGNAGITYQQMTHRWLDSDSLEAAFGPATAERRDTTIEVWCGPRPYTYKDEDGNDQQANADSRLVGTATIEFPDAPPAPEEPTAAPETPTSLTGRLIVHRAELTWNTVAGATGYELSIWDGEAWIDSNHDIFTDPDRSSLTAEIGDGEATVSPLYESSHQFRVRAVNDIGASGWSEAVTVED